MTELQLTAEERGWLERRKTGDLTPRQHLAVTELQTRMAIAKRAAGPAQDALLAESLAHRAEIAALDMETAGMKTLNALNEKLVRFHLRVLNA